ncbi:MAG TPA: hypothetical protein VGL57_10475 [Solirubrobacteraceae bacterium]|jgi:hypothetical protein
MAIDGTGDTFKYSGGSWSPVATLGSLPSDTSDLQVSCVSAQFCVAALPGNGSNENYYTYNGANWSGASVLEPTGAVASGLSCMSSTFCVAADTSDNTEKFNGSTWTAPQRHGAGTALDDQFSVSCAGTFCLADSFEDGSTYLTSDGTTWSSGSLQPGTYRQLTVSLNAAGKRLLAVRHTLTVDLSVIQNDTSPITRHIEFQAARKKHE